MSPLALGTLFLALTIFPADAVTDNVHHTDFSRIAAGIVVGMYFLPTKLKAMY